MPVCQAILAAKNGDTNAGGEVEDREEVEAEVHESRGGVGRDVEYQAGRAILVPAHQQPEEPEYARGSAHPIEHKKAVVWRV